jgi:hypothetical protein
MSLIYARVPLTLLGRGQRHIPDIKGMRRLTRRNETHIPSVSHHSVSAQV